MAHSSWLPDDLDSLLVALSNLLLLLLLIIVSTRSNWWRRRARRASRKLMVAQKRSKGLQYALNITVNQFHALRRKIGKGPRGIPLTPPLVRLDPPAKMVVPPPLDLAPLAGEDPDNWQDSGCHTVGHACGRLPMDGTQTQPIPPISSALLRSRTRPPQ